MGKEVCVKYQAPSGVLTATFPSVPKAIKDRPKWTSAESCCCFTHPCREDSTLSYLSL